MLQKLIYKIPLDGINANIAGLNERFEPLCVFDSNLRANKNNYWDRNRAETTMSRYVTSFTDRLSSRIVQAQQNEIVIKCHILNFLMVVNGSLLDSAA